MGRSIPLHFQKNVMISRRTQLSECSWLIIIWSRFVQLQLHIIPLANYEALAYSKLTMKWPIACCDKRLASNSDLDETSVGEVGGDFTPDFSCPGIATQWVNSDRYMDSESSDPRLFYRGPFPGWTEKDNAILSLSVSLRALREKSEAILTELVLICILRRKTTA